MYPFLHFTILVTRGKVSLRRKVLIRADTIAGLQELNNTTCKLVLERRDGTIEEYTVEAEFDKLKERLDAIPLHNHTTEDNQDT